MNRIYILCWGTIYDDEPHQMVHHKYYSSKRLAMEAMYQLIGADTRGEKFIDMDKDHNHLIHIGECELDNMDFDCQS